MFDCFDKIRQNSGMQAVVTVAFALLGMAIGSFLNVVIDRLPAGQSLFFPASHCPSCQRRLTAIELIPVISYLWLRGHCRYCQAAIPRRVLGVEIVSGIIFASLYLHYGLGSEMVVGDFYFSLFLVLFVIDLEHHLILNTLVYPSLVVALLFSIFLSHLEVVPTIADSAIGGAIGLGLFLLIIIVSRGGMGWGDVKMATLIGFVVGYPSVFVALFLAVVVGGLVGGLSLVFKAKSRKQSIPFGPFLSVGAMVTLIWGADLLDWYLGLF
jgi:leader peptidase (prepilin peptidase)/N-methyltransferase